jgi:glycosyltransferase involved in cell wall biosynthesis
MFASAHPPHPGGLEVMVWNLTRGLARRHAVVLVTAAYGSARGVSTEHGVNIHRLPTVHVTERFGVPYPMPTGPGVRAALLAAGAADVVHAHGALYAQTVLARRVAARARVPQVLTEHVGFVPYRSRALNAVQRTAWSTLGFPTVRRAHAIVTYNARVHEQLARDSGREIRFIGNGVDVDRFRPRPPEERRAIRRSFGLPEVGTLALFAGRDSEKKNLDVLIRARRDAYTLVVCGWQRNLEGPALVDLGLVPYARMADLFACVDLMVHPASGEGFPLAVQESVASGVPVVLLWDDGYARWMPRTLVAAVETVAEVVPRLDALAVDEGARATMGAVGREWAVRHWSWEATVSAYEELYREVIRGDAHAPH